MAKKKKWVCAECESEDVSSSLQIDKHWVKGVEVVETIYSCTCNECGYEWEKKDGS